MKENLLKQTLLNRTIEMETKEAERKLAFAKLLSPRLGLEPLAGTRGIEDICQIINDNLKNTASRIIKERTALRNKTNHLLEQAMGKKPEYPSAIGR